MKPQQKKKTNEVTNNKLTEVKPMKIGTVKKTLNRKARRKMQALARRVKK